MTKLIALVATAVIVNGERKVIQPGQLLPALSEHDSRELVQSGAAKDPVVEAEKASANAAAVEAAEADFAEARKRAVQEAQSQTQATEDGQRPAAEGATAVAPATASAAESAKAPAKAPAKATPKK